MSNPIKEMYEEQILEAEDSTAVLKIIAQLLLEHIIKD